MEKLIELLNEYAYGENEELYYRDAIVDINPDIIISKKFGFIKWLVDNEKIMVIDKEIGTSEEDYICGTKYRLFKECYSDYEILLMLLSISSSPIDDLISYLK